MITAHFGEAILQAWLSAFRFDYKPDRITLTPFVNLDYYGACSVSSFLEGVRLMVKITTLYDEEGARRTFREYWNEWRADYTKDWTPEDWAAERKRGADKQTRHRNKRMEELGIEEYKRQVSEENSYYRENRYSKDDTGFFESKLQEQKYHLREKISSLTKAAKTHSQDITKFLSAGGVSDNLSDDQDGDDGEWFTATTNAKATELDESLCNVSGNKYLVLARPTQNTPLAEKSALTAEAFKPGKSQKAKLIQPLVTSHFPTSSKSLDEEANDENFVVKYPKGSKPTDQTTNKKKLRKVGPKQPQILSYFLKST